MPEIISVRAMKVDNLARIVHGAVAELLNPHLAPCERVMAWDSAGASAQRHVSRMLVLRHLGADLPESEIRCDADRIAKAIVDTLGSRVDPTEAAAARAAADKHEAFVQAYHAGLADTARRQQQRSA